MMTLCLSNARCEGTGGELADCQLPYGHPGNHIWIDKNGGIWTWATSSIRAVGVPSCPTVLPKVVSTITATTYPPGKTPVMSSVDFKNVRCILPLFHDPPHRDLESYQQHLLEQIQKGAKPTIVTLEPEQKVAIPSTIFGIPVIETKIIEPTPKPTKRERRRELLRKMQRGR